MPITYTPEPLDTSSVELPAEFEAVIELLARHNHDLWAEQRLSEGWRYGPQRDDEHKLHPDLVPYEDLSDGEKEYDRRAARGTLAAIVALGWQIIPPE